MGFCGADKIEIKRAGSGTGHRGASSADNLQGLPGISSWEKGVSQTQLLLPFLRNGGKMSELHV